MSSYFLDDYDYALPTERIAQEAVHPHHDARVMIVDRLSGALEAESTFWDLDRYIEKDRVIFFNNSKVLPARMRLEKAAYIKKDGTNGMISSGEILFCQKQVDGNFEALVRPGNKFKIGTQILFEKGSIEVVGISENGRLLRAHDTTIEEIMMKFGELPLPPYISYDKSKEFDYQTVFAEKSGSVAAPTASLHFTRELIAKLPHEQIAITLHVGLGTFQGVDTPDIRDHHIHRETVEIEYTLWEKIATLKTSGQKILAVGTTVCRAIESLPFVWKKLPENEKKGVPAETYEYWESLTKDIEDEEYIDTLVTLSHDDLIRFSTSIFMYPGKAFHLVDDLITNFHLPKSSLLMLVSAFIGREQALRLYREAVEHEYRFFSFGDGMYLRGSTEKSLIKKNEEK